MADEIKIEFNVEGAKALDVMKKAKAEIDRLEKQWNEATEAEKKYIEASLKVGLASRAWKGANADLTELTSGWRAAGEQVAKVAMTFGGLAAAGVLVAAQAEKQESALRRLGSAYDAVQTATNGAFSAQQALTLQGQIQAAGVRVNAQQLALLTRAAREYALATGNDAAEAVEKLTNAVVNNSEDALSEMNLAQARATTSAETLANMTRLLEERFRGVAPAARTLNEDLQKLPDVLTYIGNAAARAAGGGIASFIDAVNGAGTAARMWRDIVELADTGRQNQRQQQTDANYRALQDRRQQVLNRLNQSGVELPSSLRTRLGFGLNRADDRELAALTRALDQSQQRRGAGPMRATSTAREGFDAGFNLVGEIDRSANESRYAFSRAALGEFGLLAAREDAAGRKPNEGRTGGTASTEEQRIKDELAKRLGQSHSDSNSLRGPQRDYNRAIAAAVVLGAPIVTVERARGQTLQEYWQARTAAQNISNEMTQRTREAQRQEGARMLEATRALRSSDDLTDAGITLDEMRRQLMPMMIGAAGGLNPLNDRQSLGSVLGIAGEGSESLGAMLGDIADAQEGGGAARREERARASRIASRDRETRRRARNESFLGRITSGLGMERDDNGSLRPLDALDAGAKGLVATFSTLSTVSAEFFTNVATGAMSAGDAAVLMGSKFLSTLGQMAIQEGTAMLFKSIPAFIEAPPLGAAYLAGGVGLVALGMGLGAAGAAVAPTKPSTPAASASGDRNARAIGPRSSSSSLDGGGYGDTTVVMASLVPSGVVDATNARNGLRRLARAGMDDGQRIPRRVEF